MEVFFWILIILIVIFYSWLKYGKIKRTKYQSEVNRILNDILEIDTNSISNKKFAGPMAYFDIVGESFMKLQSESFCAISIGLQYWTGILENAEEENLSEAKNLKPKLLSFLQESYRGNKISSETESKIRQLISETSKKHDLD